MRRTDTIVYLFILFLSFAAVIPATAQNPVLQEPTWLEMERAHAALAGGAYGEALRMFRGIKERNPDIPEVDIAIGEVFEAEQEYELALLQYQRAYDRRRLLLVPNDAIDLLYRMADIRELRGEYQQYEELLDEIIQKVDETYDLPPTRIVDAVARILVSGGIDKLLELYRIDDRGSLQAHAELGEYLLYTGRRFSEASKYLSFAVIIGLTEVLEYARYIDPAYEFTTVERLVADMERFRSVERYVTQTRLYNNLYLLGHSLHASGEREVAESIRSIVARIDRNGAAGRKAARTYPAL